jgi:exosortase
LLLAIPLPAILSNMITLPLQLLATKSATAALRCILLPVYREGNVIFLPHMALEVVEACSGIRSLMTLKALSVVVAVLSQPTIGRRLVMVLSSIPIVLVANACRIWGGVLAHYVGSEVADGFYHTFAGWTALPLAMLPCPTLAGHTGAGYPGWHTRMRMPWRFCMRSMSATICISILSTRTTTAVTTV